MFPSCPKCGSKEVETTLIGGGGADNYALCDCGWKGRESQLIPPEKPKVKEQTK